MKKILMLVAVALGSALFVNADNPYVGTWQLVTENGEPQSGFQKSYFPEGQFVVDYETGTERREGAKVVTSMVVQHGLWETAGSNTIVEHCSLGSKGDVFIYSEADGDNLTQTFYYTAAPGKVYVQKFTRVSDLSHLTAKQAKPLHIKGIGKIGGNIDSMVFIIDGKRVTPQDVEALEADKIESIGVIKDSSCKDYLTADEVAAGKTGVVNITLKK